MPLVKTPDDALHVLELLRGATQFAYDAETSGLDWKTNHIVGHVLTFAGGPRDTFYIPVRHAGGGNLYETNGPQDEHGWTGNLHPFEEAMLPLLSRPDKLMVGHHLSFDLGFLSRLGYKAHQQYQDTMINAYLINELTGMSLGVLCKREDVQEKLGDELYQLLAEKYGCAPTRESMAHYWKTDARWLPVWDYAVGDGTSTWQLQDALIKKIKKADPQGFTLEKVHEVESALIPVLHRMKMRGVRVDEERLYILQEEIKEEHEAAIEDIGDINLMAPTQVRKYFEDRGVTDWPLTAKGNPSFNEEWCNTNEPGKALIAARKLRNINERFLGPIVDKHLLKGRVHATYHQTRDEDYGTKTGRLSCTDPNLTAQPGKRQAVMGRRFREVYIPDEGKVWHNGDFSACEIRIATHYCKARTWLDGFTATPEIDPHTSVATSVGIKRQFAKSINLGLMTGMGKKRLAAELGLSRAEGDAIVNAYFRDLPELAEWQKDAKATYQSRGYIRTLLGRRLRLEPPRIVDGRMMNFSYKAVNRLTQGGNADIIKAKMVEIDSELGDRVQLLLNVHDDLAWQSEIGDKETDDRVIKIMEDMQEGYIKMSCPMRIDHGHGANWAEATYFEED